MHALSRKFGESPAMFPRAQAACPRPPSEGDSSSSQKMGTAPWSMTTWWWYTAMFVRAQAASNLFGGTPKSEGNGTPTKSSFVRRAPLLHG